MGALKPRTARLVAPGKVHGRLTVVRHAERTLEGRTRHYALCTCTCGSKRWVEVYSLTSGKVRSCGCAHKSAIEQTPVGSAFGRLTVESHVVRGRLLKAVCVCTCGKRPEVYVHNLISGNSRSCGCARIELLRERTRRRKSLCDELARHLSPDQIAGALVRVTPDGVEVTIPERRAA